MDDFVGRVTECVDTKKNQTSTNTTNQVKAVLAVTANPEIIMGMRRDQSFRDLVKQADMVVPDGVGLVRALQRRGYQQTERITGIDFIQAYAPRAQQRGDRLALVGAKPGVAHLAAQRLLQRWPNLQVVATDSGAPNRETAQRLAMVAPDIVFAAFGAGRQERFLANFLNSTGAAFGIGVGGAFDFLAGTIRRAPSLVQRMGLEWAWRLARQPWRLRRQAVLPLFWWLERREVRLASVTQ